MRQFANPPARPEQPVPVEINVRLACDSVTAYIQQHARELRRGGVFLATPSLRPVGTEVRFAVELSNGQRLLQGTGLVRWSRSPAGPDEQPRLPGMGLKFTHLDPESRKLVDLVVATRGANARSDEPPDPSACEAAFADLISSPAQPSTPPSLKPIATVAPPRVEPMRDLPKAASVAPVIKPVQAKAPAKAEEGAVSSVLSAPAPVKPATQTSDTVDNGGAQLRATRAMEALRVSRAIESTRRKDFARAEAELQMAIAEDPENARLRFELGLVYYQWSDSKSGDHDGAAEAAFARAVEIDPTFDQPLIHLGEVQRRRRMLKHAETSYREALRRDPHSHAAQEGLKLVRTLRWRQVALRHASVAAALVVVATTGYFFASKRAPSARVSTPPVAATPVASPTPVPAAPAQAGAAAAPPPVAAPMEPSPQAVTTSMEPANPSLERRTPAMAARKAPRAPQNAEPAAKPERSRSAASLVKKGEAALRSGRVSEAEEAFSRVIAARPGNAAAHRGLGSVFLMQGREAEAAKSFNQYLKLAPNAPDAPRIQALLQGL